MDLTKETQEELDNAQDIENMKRVEATLFISGKFLSIQEMVTLTDLNPILLQQCLGKLKDKYAEGSAIGVVNKNDLWKMDVSNSYRDIVNRLASGSAEFTKAEKETLAVIAHKQPISQAKIIAMRGNKAYDHIKKFSEVGLITNKKAGRTRELNLSEEFYDYFSLGRKKKIFESKDNEDSISEMFSDEEE